MQESNARTHTRLITAIHWLVGVAFALVGLVIFSGCASKQTVTTVYQKVYVPVKCEVKKPVKPAPSGDTVLMTLDLIEYVQALEIAIEVCSE